MWTLAIASLRFRWLSFVGIFVTVLAATALVTATGSLLEGGIRAAVPRSGLTADTPSRWWPAWLLRWIAYSRRQGRDRSCWWAIAAVARSRY